MVSKVKDSKLREKSATDSIEENAVMGQNANSNTDVRYVLSTVMELGIAGKP